MSQPPSTVVAPRSAAGADRHIRVRTQEELMNTPTTQRVPVLTQVLLAIAAPSFLAGVVVLFAPVTFWISIALFLVAVIAGASGLWVKSRTSSVANPGTSTATPTPAVTPTVEPASTTRVPKPTMSLDDQEFIYNHHAWLRFRSRFQQYFTSIGVVSLGVIATILLLIFDADLVTILGVVGATLTLGVVTLLPQLRRKLTYNPREARLPEKVQAELAARRAEELARLAAEEAEERVREEFWNRLNLAFARIAAYWRIPGFRMNLYAINPKGTAGKSQILLSLGTLAKFIVTSITATLIPVTRDRKNSTAGRHAGVRFNENPLRHSEFTDYRVKGLLATPEAYASLVATTPGGLYILVEDPNDGKDEKPGNDALDAEEANSYPVQQFRADLEHVIYHSRLVLEDGANNDIVPGSIPDIAGRDATAIMPVGNWFDFMNLEGMTKGIRSCLLRHEHKPLVGSGTPRDGRHIAIADKIRDDAVCVITNVPDGETPDFDKYTDGMGSANVVIRRDPHMFNEGSGGVKRVDINRIDLTTMLQLAELLEELCRVSAKTLGLNDSHVADIVPDTDYRYHPQMQRVDQYGRIIVHDTTPTDAVPLPPQRPTRPQVTDVSPKLAPEPTGNATPGSATPQASAEQDLHDPSKSNAEDVVDSSQGTQETADAPVTDTADPADSYAPFRPQISVGSGR